MPQLDLPRQPSQQQLLKTSGKTTPHAPENLNNTTQTRMVKITHPQSSLILQIPPIKTKLSRSKIPYFTTTTN